MRLGMEQAGHECVGFCEFDKYAVASYTSMHLITDKQREYLATLPLKQRQKEILKEKYRNGEWYAKDIKEVKGCDVPASDCWCFGSPCTSFSVAGKRAGLEGQSGLIREVFRILGEVREEDRPEWIIYENVKGMFSSNRGLDYLAILAEMDGLGYDIQWQNFNSKYYVPQNRERIYTVGHLRRYGTRKIFPVEGTDGEVDVRKIKRVAHANNFRRYMLTYDSGGLVETLDTGSGGGHNPYVCIPILTPERAKKRQNGRRLKEDGDPAFTLTAMDRHGVAIGVKLDDGSIDHPGIYIQLAEDCTVYAVWYEKYQQYIVIRKITPKESFRLQGFPDEMFDRAAFVNSDSQLFKQAGNAVTVPVVYEVASKIHT